uniref:Uncharacterized protein n=1 Tax=viral metagenome TaxID=1070528 RepID=A0A6C0H297_9ZZZZ
MAKKKKQQDNPEKYRCFKVPITAILHKDNDIAKRNMMILQDAISRANKITSKSYLLLRLWVLQKYHNDIVIPEITTDTISMAMKSVLKPSSGPKPKGNNQLLLQEFQTLYEFSLEDGKNLSAILDYYATTMLTSITNNIKIHFFDYVNRFINSYFKAIYKEEITNKVFKKQLFKELRIVKNDILNNTLLCDEKYHTWINETRYKIVPKEYDTSYYYDVCCEPYKYLKHMIFMCLELERLETKSFQFFPIQTNAVPRHIQVDTKAMVELFLDTKRDEKLMKICKFPEKDGKIMKSVSNNLMYCLEENKEFIWDYLWDVKQTRKNYQFDYTIITDGYATSLRFLHKDCVEEEQQKKDKKKAGKKALQGLTKEEKKQQQKKLTKLLRKQRMENPPKKKGTTKDLPEFPYIDELPIEALKGKHIFIDPGKRSLFTMMDDKGKFCSYTNGMRIKETKRLKYQRLLKNYKDKIHITETEETLNKYNSKSCNMDKFKEYIAKKLEVNDIVVPLYQNIQFRKYKWYAFINKKRSEDNMLNMIEKKYSKDHTIIIGDWSIGKQMRNFISTPNLSLKRKLKERFKVYNIDEFRTSCLSYKTKDLCKNLYLPDKKGEDRKIHSILTYQMENNRKGCINRDKNGCKNIRYVFNYYKKTGKRPEKFRREYKLERIASTTETKVEVVKCANA